jgi:hypothetical protein
MAEMRTQATHGPDGDIVDVYTSLPWATLCDEVSKLKISLLEGKLIELPKVVNSREPPDGGGGGLLQGLLQTQSVKMKTPKSQDLGGENRSGGGGNRTLKMAHN